MEKYFSLGVIVGSIELTYLQLKIMVNCRSIMEKTVPDGVDHAEAHLHAAVSVVLSGLR